MLVPSWQFPSQNQVRGFMKRIASVALLLGGAVFGGALAVAVGGRFEAPLAAQQTPSTLRNLPAPRQTAPTDLLQIGDRFESVARQVSPAVVYVDATKPGAA